MDIDRKLPAHPQPCSSLYLHRRQPYYIVAPAYDHRSSGVRLLHQLCSLLNQWGYEAYVDSPTLGPGLWTPQINDAIKLAHYRSGRKPIVVYSEAFKGMPLQIGQTVCYYLNKPGYFGGTLSFGDTDLLYVYHRDCLDDAPLLRLPLSCLLYTSPSPRDS